MFLKGYSNDSFINYIKRMGCFSSIIIFVNSAMCLFVGDRGPIVSSVILYFSYYYIHCKRINFVKFLVWILIAGSILSIIGFLRVSNIEGVQSSFFERSISGVESFQHRIANKISIFPPTKEVAGSVRCLHAAVNEIPEKWDFGYGKYLFFETIAIVPFWGRFVEYSGFKSSSKLYTYILSSYYERYESGYGSTIIADFYADYGLVAVILGMFFFGSLVNFCDKILYNKNKYSLFTLVLSLIYLQQSIYIARSNVLAPFKIVVMCYLFIKISDIFSKKACQNRHKI
jgi:hypothetical protein